jgi:hypothetical protein
METLERPAHERSGVSRGADPTSNGLFQSERISKRSEQIYPKAPFGVFGRLVRTVAWRRMWTQILNLPTLTRSYGTQRHQDLNRASCFRNDRPMKNQIKGEFYASSDESVRRLVIALRQINYCSPIWIELNGCSMPKEICSIRQEYSYAQVVSQRLGSLREVVPASQPCLFPRHSRSAPELRARSGQHEHSS